MLLGILAFLQRRLLGRGRNWSGGRDHLLPQVSIENYVKWELKWELLGTFRKTYQLKRNGVVSLVDGEVRFRLVVPDLRPPIVTRLERYIARERSMPMAYEVGMPSRYNHRKRNISLSFFTQVQYISDIQDRR